MARSTRILALAAAATVVGGATVAAAASLPVTSEQLYATDQNTAPRVPVVYTWASFDEPNTILSTGHPLEGGGSWIVNAGAWSINANRLRTYTSITDSSVVVDVGATDVSVSATLTLPTAGTRRAGLVVNDTGTESRLLAVYANTGGGRVTLTKSVSGASTVVAGTTHVGTPSSTIMTVTSVGTVITVSLDGTVVLTYDLSPTEAAVFKAARASRHGVVLDRDTAARVDDLRVESP